MGGSTQLIIIVGQLCVACKGSSRKDHLQARVLFTLSFGASWGDLEYMVRSLLFLEHPKRPPLKETHCKTMLYLPKLVPKKGRRPGCEGMHATR